MLVRIRNASRLYPRQFWVLAVVMMFAWTFHNMIWPFLMIYAGQTLNKSLTAIAGLTTIFAIAGMVTTFIGGAISDRFGRKWVIIVSFVVCSLSWLLLAFGKSLPYFIAFMILNGATTPLYRLSGDAMLADLVPAENRIEGYSILRMGNNLGVALGPAIGGFLVALSYSTSFFISCLGMMCCAILMIFLSGETVPKNHEIKKGIAHPFSGYNRIFRDRPFLSLVAAFSLNRISSATMWLMLGMYVKSQFSISERLFGFIPMTNALMVILFQVMVSREVKKHAPGRMMALGAAFYGLALLGIAVGQGFWAFWLCMVVATIGEMILVPTSTTSVAAMAPEDMRGRYMSVYSLTTGVGQGVGPLLGGFLSDTFAPAATWYGGGMIGFAAAVVFLINFKKKQPASE